MKGDMIFSLSQE